MKSLVHELDTTEFPRIRVGTGTTDKIVNLISYVITKVNDTEYLKIARRNRKGYRCCY